MTNPILSMLAEYFSDLEGVVDDPTRLMLARRFAFRFEAALNRSGDIEEYRRWLRRGKAEFLRDCQVRETRLTTQE